MRRCDTEGAIAVILVFVTTLIELAKHMMTFAGDQADDEPLKMDRKAYTEALEAFRADLERGGFESSADQVTRIISFIADEDCTVGELRHLYDRLDERMHDEFNRRVLYQIEKRHEEFLERSDLFGPQVAELFPSAAYDISESGNCLAMDRATACVMHLNRVLEVAFDSIETALGVTLDTDKGWEPTLRTIRDRIKEKAQQLALLNLKAFFDEVVGHLYAIKNAWRNPSVHAGAKYTETEAESILNAVKGFMQTLSKHVREGQECLF